MKINLQFVVAGVPTLLAAVVLGTLQKILPKLHGNVSWSFPPAIIVNPDTMEEIGGHEVFKRAGVPLNTDVTTFNTFGQNIEAMWTEWQKVDTRFVLVTSLGMDLQFKLGKSSLAKSHLHESGLRWVWGMVQLSEALRKRGRDDMVAELVFAPESTMPDWSSTLSSLWGRPCASDKGEVSVQSLVPKPCVYATPSGFKIVPLCENQAHAESAIDGWTGPCPRAVTSLVKSGGPLPRAIGELAVTNLFDERPLTAQEENAMSTYSMKHVSGERRLCSRPFWLRLYGLLNTPGEAALMEGCPCANMIVATTGMAVPASLPAAMAVPCGRDRYCLACERFLVTLSQCYGACDITDTLAAFLTRCVGAWTAPASSEELATWGRSDHVDRMHSCGDHCPHRG